MFENHFYMRWMVLGIPDARKCMTLPPDKTSTKNIHNFLFPKELLEIFNAVFNCIIHLSYLCYLNSSHQGRYVYNF